MIIFLFIIFLIWIFAMFFGAVLGSVAGVGMWLMKVTGYNTWWERMKIERSPENMARKQAGLPIEGLPPKGLPPVSDKTKEPPVIQHP